jgi:hypothetical protein
LPNPQKNFSPYEQWSTPDGMLTDRARGWMRSIWDYMGAGIGTVPGSSLNLSGFPLREVVSVVDYGADPTGVADSTAAFNAATLATTVHGGNDDLNMRRTIEIPPGDYKISGSVYVRNGQHLRGSGEGPSRIMLAGTTDYPSDIFKMGLGLINGVVTGDAGGAPPEISELWTYGGPSAHSVIYCSAAGYSIHNIFLTSCGIGITSLGDSGRVSGVQVDQCLTGLVIGGQNNLFTDVKIYIPNYGITTATGTVSDQSFVNLQVYYPVYCGIQFTAGSNISNFSVASGCFIMNEQYTTMTGYIQQRATSGNNIIFNNVLFANGYGPAYVHFDGADSNVTFNNCVFDGLKTVSAYYQSTTFYAAFIRSESVYFNNCTFKNLAAAVSPLYVNGDGSAVCTIRVNGGRQTNNSGSSFVTLSSTSPMWTSSIVVNGLDGTTSTSNTCFGSANQTGWCLGSDKANVLTGIGIGSAITTYPTGPKSVYFVNTASAAALVMLPTAAWGAGLICDGDTLTFIPYNIAGTSWSTNNVKFGRGAATINGAASDYTVSTNTKTTFTYNATTADWIVS